LRSETPSYWTRPKIAIRHFFETLFAYGSQRGFFRAEKFSGQKADDAEDPSAQKRSFSDELFRC